MICWPSRSLSFGVSARRRVRAAAGREADQHADRFARVFAVRAGHERSRARERCAENGRYESSNGHESLLLMLLVQAHDASEPAAMRADARRAAESQRMFHRTGIGTALSDDVERGAMGRRREDRLQSRGHGHAFVEAEQLGRDLALISTS